MEGSRNLISAGELIDKESRINELEMLKIDLINTFKNDEMDGLKKIAKEIDSRISILKKSL